MGQWRAIMALPVTVCGLLPALLLWALPRPVIGAGWRIVLFVLGGALLLAGLALLVTTIRLFAQRGHGTLAPWDPPRALVIVGVYRHVRNPMILGVMAVVSGEAALWAAPALALWALFVVVANLLYIPLSEEPALARRFGAPYARYCAHVPRWLPRWRPWDGRD